MNLKKHAFTLVELLVVVTIIVILLALLSPAMSKAVYRAQLTVCATQLRNLGSGVTMYAHENKRYYPYRGLEFKNAENKPYKYDQAAELKYHPVVAERPFDQRETLKKALPDLNKQLNDPLTGYIDIEAEAEVIFAPYNLWWGFTHDTPPAPQAMHKLGERWHFYDGPPGRRVLQTFDVLAGDRDLVRPGIDAQSSHADSTYGEGILSPLIRQNEQGPWVIAAGRMTISCWWSGGEQYALSLHDGTRSPVDNNYVKTDLSVTQIDRVHWDKTRESERIRTVSTYSNGWRGGEYDYMYVP